LLNRHLRKKPCSDEWLAMLESIAKQLANGARRLPAAAAVRRLVRQQDGAAAVEFAMVAAPFLFAGQALETAVADSSRLIMTRQAQTQGMTQAQFKDAVCAKIYGLFDCQNGVQVDVRKFSTFANITMPSPVDASGNFQSMGYDPGGPGDIVVVRLFYKYPVYVSLLGFSSSMANAGGKRLLAATAAFRNEP
jgi:Flp pilus assembly protein TadG